MSRSRTIAVSAVVLAAHQLAQILDDDEQPSVGQPAEPGRLLRHRLNEVAGQLKSELIIVSPYLVPGPGGMKFFEALRERNVSVRILTNSLASTDMSIVHSGYQAFRAPLLKSGVDLYEVRPVLGQPIVRGNQLKSPSSGRYALHAKVFVFDRARVFIGSMNLDQRSFYLNTEIGLPLTIALLIPIRRPCTSTSAPPEFPGLIAASVWMKSS